MARLLILIFFSMTVIFFSVSSHTISDVKRLYKDLFSNYTKEIIPMAASNKPLEVGIIFYLTSLNYFREIDEVISIFGILSMNWTDPSIVWDPFQYGNLYYTVIDPKDMWTPAFFLTNTVDKLEPIGHNIRFMTTIVYNGNCTFYPGGLMNAKCTTDISHFPFDTQNCHLELVFWGIPATHVLIRSLSDEVLLDWYNSNSDWSLKEHSAQVVWSSEGSIFLINLSFKRQPLYHIVVTILPTILFAILNPLVFVLPVESGERVSLAMTILLSYAIFLTLVSASIPASSNPMCILLIVMVVIIFVSGVITYGTIVSAKYYHQEDISGISSPLIWFTKWRLRKQTIISVITDDSVEANIHRKVLCSGRDVSASIDMLFFYGSFLVIVFVTIAYFFSVFL